MIPLLRKHLHILLAAGVLLLVCALQVAMETTRSLSALQELEWRTENWRVRWARRLSPDPATEKLGGVFIDETTVNWLDSGVLGFTAQWPFPRHLHAQVLEELTAQGARAVGFDILFGEQRRDMVMPGEDPVRADVLFAQALSRSTNSILGVTRENLPYEGLRTNAWKLGHMGLEPDSDGVLRRVRPFVDHPEAGRIWNLGLQLGAAELQLDLDQALVQPDQILIPKEGGKPLVIPRDPEGKIRIPWILDVQDPGPATASFAALLALHEVRREKPEDLPELLRTLRQAGLISGPEGDRPFEGRLVVVGSTMEGNNLSDTGPTPLSSHTFLLGSYWNLANAVLQGKFVRYSPLVEQVLLLLVLGLTSAYLSWALRIGPASLWVTLLILVYLGWAQYLYVQQLYLVPVFLPVAGAILLTHLTLLSYRVGFEQRERRRIRQVFARVVSPDVVQELLRSEEVHLGGARRRVTVLFTDVRGFTELTDLAQTRDEQDAHSRHLSEQAAEAFYNSRAQELLQTANLYLGAIADVIKENGGTLDKYIGDCVMAFWGAPNPESEHAAKAVTAAIAIQQKILELNQERGAENSQREQENQRRAAAGLPPIPKLPLLHLGTGINTGMVIAGLMGSEQHVLNYTVFGREVNLASRLEGVAGRSRILIGHATFLDLQSHAPDLARRCIPQPPVMVKGIHGALRTYEVNWNPTENPAQQQSRRFVES